MIDEKKARNMRAIVKIVFIGCFAAFMLATVRHLATFFNGFEQGADTLGSYLLAGAFDLTALVTTIAVMFFRKSMPKVVQGIIWFFILCITAYSFVINWEYAAHYQSSQLILQPTGAFQPVYDAAGNLHYVPVMRANTALLLLNPILASGFTAFALIYSIVAEFFGTKQPTVAELQARKAYLEETTTLQKDIAKLEGKDEKKTSLLERSLAAAKQVNSVVKEIRADAQKDTVSGTANAPQTEQQNTDQPPVKNETITLDSGTVKLADGEQQNEPDAAPDNVRQLAVVSAPTLTFEQTAHRLGVTVRHVGTLVKNRQLHVAPRNKKLVMISSIEAFEAARENKRQSAQQKKENAPTPGARKNNTKKTPKPDFASLGLVERNMYAELTKHPAEFEELMAYANSHSVEELVELLRERYPQQAGFITIGRVSNVLKYVRATRQEPQVAEGERKSA